MGQLTGSIQCKDENKCEEVSVILRGDHLEEEYQEVTQSIVMFNFYHIYFIHFSILVLPT